MNSFYDIEENLKEIRFNISEAVSRYRNSDDKVRIMAVTKTVPFENVNHAISLGIDLLGENKVQEYQSKMEHYDKSAEVQFIGHLQTNKVKYIINNVSMIQSVDSMKLASEINRLAVARNVKMEVLCEVNIGDEESKSGVASRDLHELINNISQLENIRVRGLMTIPPPSSSDIYLAKMQELFMKEKEYQNEKISMDILSMGMTHDYVQAVKYGSTLVRIGTGLFGARVYK